MKACKPLQKDMNAERVRASARCQTMQTFTKRCARTSTPKVSVQWPSHGGNTGSNPVCATNSGQWFTRNSLRVKITSDAADAQTLERRDGDSAEGAALRGARG